MRFLADETCDAAVVRALRAAGHDVKAVGESAPGATDSVVLESAALENRVVLTEDKDFGRLVFASRSPVIGVVLMRFPATARSALVRSVLHLIDSGDTDLERGYSPDAASGCADRRNTRSRREHHSRSRRVDTRTNGKIDGMEARMNVKFETLNSSIANAKFWALPLYIALAAVNLGTLARGFGWI